MQRAASEEIEEIAPTQTSSSVKYANGIHFLRFCIYNFLRTDHQSSSSNTNQAKTDVVSSSITINPNSSP